MIDVTFRRTPCPPCDLHVTSPPSAAATGHHSALSLQQHDGWIINVILLRERKREIKVVEEKERNQRRATVTERMPSEGES